jgi:hypothetical protein
MAYCIRIDIEPGQQTYSIRNGSIKIIGISINILVQLKLNAYLHNPPPAIVRYFDPFVGTGLGSQQLLDAFDFGGFSPSVSFMMMPITCRFNENTGN